MQLITMLIGFLVHKFKNPDMHVNTTIEFRNPYCYGDVFPCKIASDPSSLKKNL